jgi:hypothetical protein
MSKFTAREPHDDALDVHYAGLERLPDRAPTEERPHGCIGGYVFLGHLVVDEEDGEEVEVVEAVPCRRCARRSLGKV